MKEHEPVLVPLAPGFEEIEAITIVDVLRRAGLEVVVAGLAPGPVTGSHAITVVPDTHLGAVELARVRMLVLPGGMPGTRHLMADERVLALVRRLHAEGRRTAALCAAPLVLHAAGVTAGLRITAHPSVRKELAGVELDEHARVVRSGTVTTSSGAGTAMEFALALVADVCGAARTDELARAMLAR